MVRNLFGSISTLEKKNEEHNGCCNLNYKLGVQIMAGLLTIFSAVFLVLHHLKVKEMIDAKFERMFKQEPRPEWNLTVSNMAIPVVECSREGYKIRKVFG